MPVISPDVLSKVLLSVAVLSGAALCFFGYRLFQVALGVAGFACGAMIAAYVAWSMTAPSAGAHAAATYPDILNKMMQAPNPTVLIVWACAGGIAGAILSVLMQRVGVFVLGAWLGWLFTNLIMVRAPMDSYLTVLAILGLAGGIAALVLRRFIIIVSTALNGASAFMLGVYALLQGHSPEEALKEFQGLGNVAYVLVGCTIILALIGGYVQWITTRGKEGKKEEPTPKSAA